MNAHPLAIRGIGLLTAVGADAPSSCAAFRAKVANPTPTRFMDSTGEWILAHQVWPDEHERGLPKLARMAAMVIEEAMVGVPKTEWSRIPLLLCLAEPGRPGRPEGLDENIFHQIEERVGARFSPQSGIVTQGRVGAAVALAQARRLMLAAASSQVLIAAVDSLIDWRTLVHLDRADRLLSAENSNGFMAGEGAGALLIGAPSGMAELLCTGIGFAREPAHIHGEEPLRADGLSSAIRAALAEAGQAMHDYDYRITDLSGEQYYFKEASLAVSRVLRQPKEDFDLWHPAECTGEAGALAGAAIIALAASAGAKAYGSGPNVVAHMSNDGGQRAALSLEYRSGE